jgi:hypothetical protein
MLHLTARYPLLGSPQALAAFAAAAAIVAGLLLGAQDASAGIIIHNGARR